MNDPASSDALPTRRSIYRRLARSCRRFNAAWRAGQRPRIEDFLAGTLEPDRAILLGELLKLEVASRRVCGESPMVEEYQARFPDDLPTIFEAFDEPTSSSAPSAPDLRETYRQNGQEKAAGPQPTQTFVAGQSSVPGRDTEGFVQRVPLNGASSEALPRVLRFARGHDPSRPRSRYTLFKLLGRGGYGKVYLARDEELSRAVAIKVARPNVFSTARQVDLFLKEAQLAAGLTHPRIVRVYDVGRQENGRIFVVMEYIAGQTLWDLLRAGPLKPAAATRMMVQLAETMSYAHNQGLIHRDLKPSNILIDLEGNPHVSDFGLAIRADPRQHNAREIAGTPAYMAPEQVRGETHHCDGRTDLWGLGVIFYEMLTHRQPFTGPRAALFEEILNRDPQPPRQIDDTIPWELERICGNCLAKRRSDRYSTAVELVDDLNHWLTHQSAPETTAQEPPTLVIPRGLKSFEEADSGWFLNLLPGTRDRYGLPLSLKFWKTGIEETDPAEAFSVGLLYGPSGSGKSSLLKAGLLPRVAPHVLPIRVEATATGLEARLLAALKSRCAGLALAATLPEALTAIREGPGAPPGRKVLVIIDQFEQWLHAHRRSDDNELIRALRQCDGGRLQCLLLVRDDFWTAVSRFMRNLEIPLEEGRNAAPVSLFDADHARKVLTEFGRYFGSLPRDPQGMTSDQGRFLDQAISTLAGEDGKVIPIRLCLFAEMVREKPWTGATFRALGGIGGIGVAFLEETFSAPTALPAYRLHQGAASAILKALLPVEGPDLKGRMRSRSDLIVAAEYTNREPEFDELLQALDTQLRLITLIDPREEPEEESHARHGERYYQLSHDYLVPAIRQWLTRKQSESIRGRAEILLAERAALWSVRRDRRQLPSWWEFLSARILTRSRSWTLPQRKMMRAAHWYHLAHGLILVAGLALLGVAAREGYGRFQGNTLRRRLVEANITDVPAIVREIEPFRPWVDDLLRAEMERPIGSAGRRRLHASLALLPVDPRQAEFLTDRLLDAEPHDLLVIREALRTCSYSLTDHLWAVLKDPGTTADQRLRAACGLAEFAPNDPRWNEVAPDVVAKLCTESPVVLGFWIDSLRRVQAALLPALERVYGDEQRPDERYIAACVLAEFLEGDVDALVAHTLSACPRQLGALLPKVAAQGPKCADPLIHALDSGPSEAGKDADARRIANAAVALLAVDRKERVWPMLQARPDPRLRTYLIHRLGPARMDPRVLTRRLEEETDASGRQALILALGEYREDALPSGTRTPLVRKLLSLYQSDPDPGVHSAVEWLLRRWNHGSFLKAIDDKLAGIKPPDAQRWFVNNRGHMFAILRQPSDFLFGGELGGRKARVSRNFGLATKNITIEEFESSFREVAPGSRESTGMPVTNITWFQAVAYCRWLSECEGIDEKEMCYPPLDQIRPGMRLQPGYLQRKGYRLPTEAEWEYACRAGTATSRPFGCEDRLLPYYAWTVLSANGHAWPSGRLKPNDWGFFDILGNVYEWCHALPSTTLQRDPALILTDDEEEREPITDGQMQVARGGSFSSATKFIYPSIRNENIPSMVSPTLGFRVARTCD